MADRIQETPGVRMMFTHGVVCMTGEAMPSAWRTTTIEFSHRFGGGGHLQGHPQSWPVVFEGNRSLQLGKQRAHEA
jgi:hypothetical protein